MASDEGRVRGDLGTINRWLCRTRLRACLLVFLFALVARLVGGPIEIWSASAVLASLSLFSVWLLFGRGWESSERSLFYTQVVVDLIAVTIGLGAALSGPLMLAFRMLFVLVIIPPSLVSIPTGLFAAAGATLGHECLLGMEKGFSWATASSLESLAPSFLFFLVAQQCFFYGAHLEAKNRALAHLAERLDDSRRGLAELVGIARVLNSTVGSRAVVAHVNRLARERLHGDWSATLLIDRARGSFRVAAAEHAGRGVSHGASTTDLPLETWPALERLASSRQIVLFDGQAGTVPEVLREGRCFGCVLLAGLFRDEALVGALVVAHADVPAEVDTGSALQRLAEIAEHATIALRNAELLEEAREASALKSEFVSTMSHELRTPLNVILGYTEILRDEAAEAPSEVRDLLGRIQTCGRELLELVDATLQVGRLDAGAISVQIEEVRVGELTHAIEASVSGLPRSPDVELRWERHVDPAATVRTDRAKAALVVRNLMSNALKFTRSGSVEVVVRGVDAALEIEVRDTGPGIPPEQLPLIFEMFRQVGTPPSGAEGGVGLGLYIVDQLVRRLGGTVAVQSEVGRGTTFVLRIPELRQTRVSPPVASPPTEVAVSPTL